jgi:hypothetical protein
MAEAQYLHQAQRLAHRALFLAQNSPQQQLRGLLRHKVWKAVVLSARTKEAAKTPTNAIVQSKEQR